MSLTPGWAPHLRHDDPRYRMVFARMVTHLWSRGCFLADGQVLAGTPPLRGTPGVLVHGRHDVSSPTDTT